MIRQEIPLNAIQVPFFVHFFVETFPFGREPWLLVIVAVLAGVATIFGTLVKYWVLRPLITWAKHGPDVVEESTVVRHANLFATVDATIAVLRYSFSGVVAAAIAYFAWDATIEHLALLAAFGVANGALVGTVFFFTAESEADRFLCGMGRDALGEGFRLPLSWKIPTFVLIVVGYLLAFGFLMIQMIQAGLMHEDTMGAHVYPFALATLAYILVGLYYFRGSISAKFANLNSRLSEICAGESDLSQLVPLGTGDEATEVADQLNAFIRKLSNTVVEIVQTAEEVQAAARDFSGAADGLAEDASGMSGQSEEAAAAVMQLSSGLAVIANSVGAVSKNVSSVASTTGGVSTAVEEVAGSSGHMTVEIDSVSAAVEEMSASLNEVAKAASRASASVRSGKEQARLASDQMERLDSSAGQVAKIVELIEDIADKTNLLALKATIEAASAGDAGRGFAVVASEVKDLARQTTAATEQIAAQIEQMRRDTRHAVAMIHKVTDQISEVDDGSARIASSVEEQTATIAEISGKISRTAGAASAISTHMQGISAELGQIANRSSEMTQGADSINNSSVDAAAGANQVSGQLAAMNRLVGGNAQRATEVRSKASHLAQLSDALSRLVGQFKTA